MGQVEKSKCSVSTALKNLTIAEKREFLVYCLEGGCLSGDLRWRTVKAGICAWSGFRRGLENLKPIAKIDSKATSKAF